MFYSSSSSQDSISTNSNRKRSMEDEEESDYNSSYSEIDPNSSSSSSQDFKKLQRYQIHSELHYHSINVLVESSKQLYHHPQERPQDQPSSEEVEGQDIESESQYYQKPFWPQVNKVKP